MRERVTRRQTYFGLCALVRGWADALSAMRVCLCVLDSTSCRIRVRVLSSRARGGRSRFYVWREACAVCRGQKGMCSSRSSDKSGRDAEKNHPEYQKTHLTVTLSLKTLHISARYFITLTAHARSKPQTPGSRNHRSAAGARGEEHTAHSPVTTLLISISPLSRGHKPA